MYQDGNVLDDVISRPAAAPIGEKLFAYINSDDKIALALDGGDIDGVTTSAIVDIGTGDLGYASLYTEGGVIVKATGVVTAGKEVMVYAGGAVNATFGNKAVAYAETSGTEGDDVRVILYDRPFRAFGSGLGAEKIVRIPLAGAALHGGVQAWQNPEAATAILVTREVIDVKVAAAAAAAMDSGTTAVSAVTASDNLFDEVDLHAVGQFDTAVSGGVNGKGSQKLPAGAWITFKEASGDATGAVIDVYIFYLVIG